MIRIGILSDTHLSQCTPKLKQEITACFKEVSIIFHAGDLTNSSILEAFGDKKVYAVHGNMCDTSSSKLLPRKIEIELGGYRFGIIHRTGRSYDFETELLDEFPEADCIVYGHTHQAVCHKIGGKLLINPGSFIATSRHGAPGTYAILELDSSLRCSLYEVNR